MNVPIISDEGEGKKDDAFCGGRSTSMYKQGTQGAMN